MKDINTFIEFDKQGHIERSAGELKCHSAEYGLPVETRKAYYEGILSVFPLMLVGHYYGWTKDIHGPCPEYDQQFFAKYKDSLSHVALPILDKLFAPGTSLADHLTALGAYIASYPVMLLDALTAWGYPESVHKLEQFHTIYFEELLPLALEQIHNACGNLDDDKGHLPSDLVVWLGCELPFEILRQYHITLFS